jgi:NMD protein affecting ribosome stability and mRNA decay
MALNKLPLHLHPFAREQALDIHKEQKQLFKAIATLKKTVATILQDMAKASSELGSISSMIMTETDEDTDRKIAALASRHANASAYIVIMNVHLEAVAKKIINLKKHFHLSATVLHLQCPNCTKADMQEILVSLVNELQADADLGDEA